MLLLKGCWVWHFSKRLSLLDEQTPGGHPISGVRRFAAVFMGVCCLLQAGAGSATLSMAWAAARFAGEHERSCEAAAALCGAAELFGVGEGVRHDGRQADMESSTVLLCAVTAAAV